MFQRRHLNRLVHVMVIQGYSDEQIVSLIAGVSFDNPHFSMAKLLETISNERIKHNERAN